jgi:hypothetical protein
MTGSPKIVDRVKAVTIPSSFFLSKGVDPGSLDASNFPDLPGDARVIEVRFDMMMYSYVYFLRHPSFAEIEEGQPIPVDSLKRIVI